VEFCCYAAKVVGNDKRALDWMAAGEDAAAAVRFHRPCQIPIAYESDDYRFLWPLIAFYDLASDYGVHANFGSLAGAYGGSTEKQLFLNQQSGADLTIRATILLTGLGYRVYKAMLHILKPCIMDSKQQDRTFEYVREEVKNLRLSLAKSSYVGQVPGRVVFDILADRTPLSVKQFKEYVRRVKKKCPKCGEPVTPQPDKCLQCGGEVVPQPNKCMTRDHEF
jgi:Zn finger protein HypA/HybF involved in hydrogenase expression